LVFSIEHQIRCLGGDWFSGIASEQYFIWSRLSRVFKNRGLQTFTFGENLEILQPTTIEPYEQPHKISVTFPDDGEYVVELSMEVEGKEEVIPFMLVVGNPSSTGSILVAVAIGLVVFIIAIRAIKIKRQRRLNLQGDTDEQV